MFLVNSRQRDFRCGPTEAYASRGQTLSLTYGRFFAEFLKSKSLVPLGLLALSTCVGFRYGCLCISPRCFSWKALHLNRSGKNRNFPRYSLAIIKDRCIDLLHTKASYQERQTIKALKLVSFVPSSEYIGRARILTGYPSAAALAIALGPPNPWLIASATETLDFRGLNFSLGLWLLIPTFSLLYTPPLFADAASARKECSPTAYGLH